MILLRHLRIEAFKHLRNIDLWFPRQGSVLIEGHNESGKSTLFEAIYFALYGKALVGEDSGAPSLEALVPHGESRALVYLAVQVGTTELEITRTLARGANPGAKAKHDVKLRILRPDRQVETISAISAANDAILNEMNGLDSNVLRNSCLMEQQALDRIESLSKSDREMAIAKLLGIEAIQRIEHDLKVATKDSDALAQAQTRLEVARKYAEAQQAASEAQRLSVALLAAKAHTALVARDSLAARMREVETQLAEAEREMAQLRESSQHIAALDTLRARSDETAQLLREAEREASALESMRARNRHATSEVITSQLAQADADIKAAEAREHEQRLQVARARGRTRNAGLFLVAAILVALVAGAATVVIGLSWLLATVIAFVLAAIVEFFHLLRMRAMARDERAKLTALENDLIRLRARHEAVQQFGMSPGEQETYVTPEALVAQQHKATTALASCAAALRELAQPLSKSGIAVSVDSHTLDSVDAVWRAHETQAQALQAETARLNAPATQQQYGTLGEIERQARAKWDELTAQRDEARQRLVDTLVEAGVAATGDESMETLVAGWPDLAHAGDTDTLADTLTRASAIEGRLRQEVEALCQQYGFDADTLDVAECQKAYDDLAQEQRQRRLAAEMADEVFKRIVQRVLPETEMHMRALLPDLTDGRYRDVRLLGDGNSADLRIELWDEQAERYVGKHLFSGGTRDQCSLALRLAFALATLPKELGAMPGFIFLDEPLSSFDDRRSQALVDVLTRGPIAKQFPQVFLISHSQSFDPAAFTCALRMAGGRVASSTLPDEAAARALWDAA